MKVRLQIGRNNKGEIHRFEGEPNDFLVKVPLEYRGIVREAIGIYGNPENKQAVTYSMQLPQHGRGPRRVIISVQRMTGNKKQRAEKEPYPAYYCGGWEPDSMY